MSESTNICLSCGLCCDGTLVGFVQLNSKEVSDLKSIMEIEEYNETGFFLLPCSNLGCDGCKIYTQRPKNCDKFKCGLLKSVNANSLKFETAFEVVEQVKRLKASIEKVFTTLQVELNSKSFYFKIQEVKKLQRETPPSHPLAKELLFVNQHLTDLDNILDQYFDITIA